MTTPQSPRSNRRHFIRTSLLAGAAGLAVCEQLGATPAESKPQRKFTVCLACGLIGVAGDPQKVLGWAKQYGFESIEPSPQFLAKLSDSELQDYLAQMKQALLAWGAAGFPVDFRSSDANFEQGMKALPDFAKTLQRAGVTRTATWLSPGHNTLTYNANFKSHARRLREGARVLADHGIQLGLEYVGPKTSWSSSRYPFIHTMAEMKELIAEIGLKNVGFLLDSWHWYTAQETEADLLSLRASDVVLCHLNDAPKDVPVLQQVDSRRDLPCATGVIDVKGYLGALIKIGYEGPVACEPFSQDLRKMQPEQAVETVAAAMKKAVSLAEA